MVDFDLVLAAYLDSRSYIDRVGYNHNCRPVTCDGVHVITCDWPPGFVCRCGRTWIVEGWGWVPTDLG